MHVSIGPLNNSGTGSVSLNLSPGTYSVSEDTLPDWTTFPNPQTITITSGNTTSILFNNQHNSGGNGTLVINKVTTPTIAGVGATFNYTINPGNIPVSIGPLNNSGTGDFILTLPAGDYSIMEIVPSGWTTFPNPQTGTIVPGNITNITFNNQSNGTGTLIINKTTTGDATGITFNYNIQPGGYTPSITVTGTSGTVSTVIPVGTYSVTESSTSGWTATINPVTGVDILPGGTSLAHFTNTQTFATLVINKSTQGSAGGVTFDYTIEATGHPGFNASITVTGTSGTTQLTIAPSVIYTVTEILPQGWTAISQNPIVGGASPGGIGVVNFFNGTLPPGTLTINKVAFPAASGIGVTFGYNIEPGGIIASVGPLDSSGTGHVNLSLLPGNYSVTETFPSGWTASVNPQTFAITSFGATSIEFDNTYLPAFIGTIMINKTTATDGSGVGFDYVVTGPSGFSQNVSIVVTGTSGTVNVVVPTGTGYSVTELSTSGWTATTNPVTGIIVPGGGTVGVPFTNQATTGGVIHITKTAISDTTTFPATTNFTFTVDQLGVTATIPIIAINGTVTGETNISVPAGTYSVTEDILSGWHIISSNPVTNIIIQPGQTASIGFTNTHIGVGSVTINKTTTTTVGGSGVTFNYNLQPGGYNGSITVTGTTGSVVVLVASTFAYTITEATVSGWTATVNPVTTAVVPTGGNVNANFTNTSTSGGPILVSVNADPDISPDS